MTEIRSRLPNFDHSYLKKKGTRDPETIILMVWVPSTKVHAHVVLSKHVRQNFFFTLIKLCKVENVTEIRTNTVLFIVFYCKLEGALTVGRTGVFQGYCA